MGSRAHPLELERVRSDEKVAEVAALADEIWNEHFPSIIGQAQVDYMLDKFQSERAIAEQIAGDYEYYLIEDEAVPVGYIALVPEQDKSSALLSKIYVQKRLRGRGLGKAALEFAEQLCRESNIATLWLTVNKHNSRSIKWYQRVGFTNVGPIVMDIGGGFIMDDFKFEKPVPPTS